MEMSGEMSRILRSWLAHSACDPRRKHWPLLQNIIRRAKFLSGRSICWKMSLLKSTNQMRRPDSLAQVAEWSVDSTAFEFHFVDFLDQFYAERRPEMLSHEPRRLVALLRDEGVADAYLGATAVSLARLIGVVPPLWALHESRKLKSPWFAHPGAAVRATLLAESPAPFRERNLFVSENALARA
jgi:hypothetical protein